MAHHGNHSMRGKDYSTGLRGGLFEAHHYARMGTAIWLYGWLVLRQTNQREGMGWVLGGKPITYREIEEETGFNRRTLERWMRDLRRAGYIEREIAPAGIIVRITKAKKFPQFAQGGLKSEGGARRLAESGTQNCVANGHESHSHQPVTDRIGSSYIAGSIEKQRRSEIHRDFHSPQQNQIPGQKSNPSWLDQNQTETQNPGTPPNTRQSPPGQQYRQLFIEAIRRRELLRAEREEEVRRELAVGAGPELRRS